MFGRACFFGMAVPNDTYTTFLISLHETIFEDVPLGKQFVVELGRVLLVYADITSQMSKTRKIE